MKRETRLGGVSELRASALLAVAYCVAALISIDLSRRGDGIAGIWFANALAFVIAMRRPGLPSTHLCAAVFMACLAANLIGGSSPATALIFSLFNCAHVAICVLLAVRLAGPRPQADPGVRGFAAVLAATVGVATTVSALAFAAAATLSVGWPFIETASTWWASTALGFAVVLPAGLYLTVPVVARLQRPERAIRVAGLAAACAVVAALSLMSGPFPFAFAMLPLLIVSTRGDAGEMAAVATVTGLALLGAAYLGQVPGLASGSEAFRDGFQIAIGITLLTPVFGALVFRQMARDRKRISESEQRFRSAMHNSSVGLVIVSLDGTILETNAPFTAMLGYADNELDGRTFYEFSHPDDRAISAETMRKVRDGETSSFRYDKRYLRKDRSVVSVRIAGSVICDQDSGAPLYLVTQVEDIEARSRSDAAIAEAETRWNFALASAGQGAWELDLRRGGCTYSSTWKKMLGYDEDALDGEADRWLTMVHPDDLPRVLEADRAHLDGRSDLFEAEFRMRRKDGSWIWILDRGRAVERDGQGKLVRAIGTLTDITARKEAEQRLAQSAALLADEKERLRVTLESIGDAVICVDAANLVTFMNPVAEKLTRVARAEALGKPLARTYWSADEETGERTGVRRGAGAGAVPASHNSRALLVRQDGTRCSIREVTAPIVNERGEFCGSVIVFQDFTDARTLQRELAHAASHDALTGLANRSSFLSTMRNLLEQARRDRAEHQFMYLDLDHFKSVNDTSGHAAGDDVLKQVTETIRATLRPGDIAARLGGDEFGVVLRDCPAETGSAIAQSVVDALARMNFAWRGRTHRIGASAGMAPIRFDSGEVDEIIARADEACYEAKSAGRGRVSEKTGVRAA